MAVAFAEVPKPYILNPKEIIELAAARISRFRDRDALYDLADLYYYGSDLSDGSVGVLAANAQGRPLLRDLEQYKTNGKVYSAQRLSPIVDDYQALLGQMPSSRVDPPDSSPAAEKHAELVTKYLISTHDISDMERQQIQAGFDLPAYGDACYVLEVDSELKRVVWSVVKPRTAYPEFYRGHKKYLIADLIIRTVESPDVIRRAYGFTPKTSKEEDCAVTIYVSAFQRTVVIGTKGRIEVGPDVEWKLGFCPAQWVFNKVNGRYGQSDINQSFAQQDFMDFAYNILIDGLVRNTYGTIIGIRNPQNTGQEQIQVGPNPPPILLQEDGSITATQVGGDVAPAMKMIDHTLADMNATTGTSQVRQEGQMHGSVQTGRGMHAAQGPQATRVELKLTNLGAALKSANSMTIQMQVNAPYIGKEPFDIFGKFKGAAFAESLSGEQLKWQGAIWTRNSVRFDAMIGLNLQQKEQIATQGMMSEIWDDIHARELVGVDDPIGMRGRIEQMKVLKAGVEAKVQAAMQPAGAGGPGGGSSGSPSPVTGARPGGGAPGGAPPSGAIKRPMGLGAAPPPGGAPGAPMAPPAAPPQPQKSPLGVDMKAIQTALVGIEKPLRGNVWVIGEVALTGTSDKVQLLVEDARDQPAVTAAMRTIAQIVQVRAAKPGKELPVEAVKVA